MIQDASNIFNSSVLSNITESSESMSREELLGEIIPKIQAILDRYFPDEPAKRKIKIYKDRVSFAAPCCGDSAHDASKKRGNIILEGKFKNMYKCHNCGACMSMYNFFKKFGEGLSLKAINYVVSNKPSYSDSSVNGGNMSAIYDVDIIDEFAIDREYFKAACHLEDCDVMNAGRLYLINRAQYNFKKFLYHPRSSLLFVLNLTPSGKIIGLQVRSLNKYIKGGNKYKTYKLSKIYSLMLHQEKEIPENIDDLSMLFNILLIDYTKPVTVVEGPMDSFLMSNCVATCGAGHHFDFSMAIVYLYDDDLAGRKHAIEKLNEGKPVFMWSKFKKDMGMPDRAKWDLNDVIIWSKQNKVQLPRLAKYFTNNKLDSFYL